MGKDNQVVHKEQRTNTELLVALIYFCSWPDNKNEGNLLKFVIYVVGLHREK